MPTERNKSQDRIEYPVYRASFSSIVEGQKTDYTLSFVLTTREEEEELRSGFNFIVDQIIEHSSTNICLMVRNSETREKNIIAVSNVVSFYTNFDLAIPKRNIGEIDE